MSRLPTLKTVAAETRHPTTQSSQCSNLGHPAGYVPYSMADVRRSSDLRRFTFSSTFAGGGGSATGYRLAGGVAGIVNEFVPTAADTYERNFPETVVDRRDIRDIIRSPSGVDDFLGRGGVARGELDILDGSPPCSEFSVAGSGIGDQDRLRKYSDVKQRGIATLPFDFVEVAGRAQPKVVVCENVPGLASSYPDVLENLLETLKWRDGKRAYFVNWKVLSASDYGVGQKRKRLFIIGVREDVAKATGFSSDDSILQLFPEPTNSSVTIRTALAGLVQSERDISPWRQSAASTKLGSQIRRLPKDPAKHTRLCHVSPGETKSFTLTRCAWDLPSPTLVVTGQKPDGLCGAIHPEFDRKFTLPELKRLFGLPDDYSPTGTLSQAAERICRMVPPFLTEAIAESIYDKILRPYAEVMK